ncbi:MAG: tRNA (adenosine(37)-N6)-threonylcarbamoyltransferase complex transferase subunit TsaD [Candidatus Pacebacteria bacterium]|nr:tRNA (adenosine(37)-N6)-threonylcarbamoyltransferase complex transferase subunit TsaD [Candidatus Paceibacterota bacterium]
METVKILSIETSCDETAIAVVECSGGHTTPSFIVRAHVIATQIATHRPFGGVVPSLAKREHLINLPLAYTEVFEQLKAAGCEAQFDRIAVTVGPGLEPALWTGINFANDVSIKIGVPIVGVNHLEGHIYSNWLDAESAKKIQFPAVVLLVSGGHTTLVVMDGMQSWRKLGETQDDAAGEAFDKVAKMLGLPYPGGPEVERMAREGNADAIPFPRPMLHSGDCNFSFSGLKTSVLYHMKAHPDAPVADVCASFQKAAIDVLCAKTMRAAEENGAQSVLVCGGVASNAALHAELKKRAEDAGMFFFAPAMQYNGDNAVMIAAASYLGTAHPVEIALPNLNL